MQKNRYPLLKADADGTMNGRSSEQQQDRLLFSLRNMHDAVSIRDISHLAKAAEREDVAAAPSVRARARPALWDQARICRRRATPTAPPGANHVPGSCLMTNKTGNLGYVFSTTESGLAWWVPADV